MAILFKSDPNRPFVRYLQLLSQLKVLISREEDESDGAEQLRGEMDSLWLKIREPQRREINRQIKLPVVE